METYKNHDKHPMKLLVESKRTIYHINMTPVSTAKRMLEEIKGYCNNASELFWEEGFSFLFFGEANFFNPLFPELEREALKDWNQSWRLMRSPCSWASVYLCERIQNNFSSPVNPRECKKKKHFEYKNNSNEKNIAYQLHHLRKYAI